MQFTEGIGCRTQSEAGARLLVRLGGRSPVQFLKGPELQADVVALDFRALRAAAWPVEVPAQEEAEEVRASDGFAHGAAASPEDLVLPEPFVCDFEGPEGRCGAQFPTHSRLLAHRRLGHDEQPHLSQLTVTNQCPLCRTCSTCAGVLAGLCIFDRSPWPREVVVRASLVCPACDVTCSHLTQLQYHISTTQLVPPPHFRFEVNLAVGLEARGEGGGDIVFDLQWWHAHVAGPGGRGRGTAAATAIAARALNGPRRRRRWR